MNEKVQVLSELRLPVCTYMSCKFAVKINYLPAHLKDTHNYEHDNAVAVAEHISSVIWCMDQTDIDKEKAEMYFNAGNMAQNVGGKLPPLLLLRVAEGWRCAICTYCAISMGTMWKQAQAKHGEVAKVTSPSDMFRDAVKFSLQSIFGGSKKRWFEVSFEAGDIENSSCPLRFMKQFNVSAGIEHVGDDPSRMNDFLATVRSDSILKEHGINIADSWMPIRGEDQGRNQTHVTMSCCVNQYFLTAFRACQRNPVVTSHSVQGSRLRLCLERNTLERYDSELWLLLKFTQNCVNEKMIFVPSNVAEKTESLVSALNGDTEDVLTKMQAFMCTLILDIIEARKGDVGLIGV
jgi:hypothetical protein